MSAGIDLSYQELIQQCVNELVKIGRILAEEDYFVNCSSPKEMDRAAFIEKYPEAAERIMVISAMDFGMMNGEKILKDALNLIEGGKSNG